MQFRPGFRLQLIKKTILCTIEFQRKQSCRASFSGFNMIQFICITSEKIEETPRSMFPYIFPLLHRKSRTLLRAPQFSYSVGGWSRVPVICVRFDSFHIFSWHPFALGAPISRWTGQGEGRLCPFYVFDAVRRESFLENVGGNGSILLVGIAFKLPKNTEFSLKLTPEFFVDLGCLDFCAIMVTTRIWGSLLNAMHLF